MSTMTPLGLVETEPLRPSAPVSSTPRLQLRVEDALASSKRLWVRGRLVGLEQFPKRDQDPPWWRFWSRRGPQEATPEAALETAVSGTVLRASVPVQADGRFEALFSADLPPARRGWRLARNRVTFGDQTLD